MGCFVEVKAFEPECSLAECLVRNRCQLLVLFQTECLGTVLSPHKQQNCSILALWALVQGEKDQQGLAAVPQELMIQYGHQRRLKGKDLRAFNSALRRVTASMF